MSRFQSSHYRFAKLDCKANNPENFYVGLSPSQSAPLAATRDYVAVCVGEKGDIQLLPTIKGDYDAKAEPNLIRAHSESVTGLSFNPFAADQLYTASIDSTVKMWQCPSNKNVTSVASNGALNDLSVHRSANGIVAVGGKSGIEVLDMNGGKNLYSGEIQGFGKDILSVDWTYNGDQILGVGKNSQLHAMDPRAGIDLSKSEVIKNFRPERVINIGKVGYFLILGADKSRKPKYLLYDARKVEPNAPLWSKFADFSTGHWLSMYDVDTDLLFLCMRGSASIQTYDISKPDNWNPVDRCVLSGSVQGVGIAHKSVCDTYHSEVNRIYASVENKVFQIPVKVPRKKAGFNPELYPNTYGWDAALSAEEWSNGSNKAPVLVDVLKLRDTKLAANNEQAEKKKEQESSSSTTTLATNNNSSTTSAKLVEEEKKPAPVVYKPSATRKKIEALVKKSLFANVRLKEPDLSSDKHYYDVRPDQRRNVPGSQNLKLNHKYWACPWTVVGGSALVVWPHDKFGRLGDDVKLVRGHKSQVVDFDLCDWDPNLLVTCGENGHAYVWNITDCQSNDLNDPVLDLRGSGKMTHIRLHPYVRDLLVTSSMGFDGYHLRVWNLANPSEPKLHINCHPEPLFDISFSYDGKYIITTSRDGIVRIISIITGDIAYQFKPEGSKDCRVFMTQENRLITCGFGARSSRMIELWNLESLDKSVTSIIIDNTNSVLLPFYDEDTQLLYVASKGSKIIRLFQLGDTHIEWLLNMNASHDIFSVAFFHKVSCDVRRVVINRALFLSQSKTMPAEFSVPRKRVEYFQDDLYSATLAAEAFLTCEELYNGVELKPKYIDLCPDNMKLLSEAPPEQMTKNQLKYKKLKEEQAKEKPKGLFGTAEDTEEHFRQIAESGTNRRNRWDKTNEDDTNDVDSEEWSD